MSAPDPRQFGEAVLAAVARGEGEDQGEPVGGGGLDLDRLILVSPDPSRVAVEVVTTSGRGTQVVFQLQRDLVEVLVGNQLWGEFDRDRRRTWLRDPIGALEQGQVRLGLDRMVDQNGRIALTLPFVRDWTLSPVERQNLKDRV